METLDKKAQKALRQKQWYESNKEKVKEQAKAYREANKDKKKEWYEANKERILSKGKEYRETNKQKKLDRDRNYREANREKLLEGQRNYRENNRGKLSTRQKKYYEDNENKRKRIERGRLYRHSNRAVLKARDERRRDRLKLQNNQTITPDFISILFRDSQLCPYCGKKMLDVTENILDRKSLDHLIPISKGGLHAQHNVTVCCYSCNSRKNRSTYLEWLNVLDEPHKTKAEKLYIKQYGVSPIQGVLPLTF